MRPVPYRVTAFPRTPPLVIASSEKAKARSFPWRLTTSRMPWIPMGSSHCAWWNTTTPPTQIPRRLRTRSQPGVLPFLHEHQQFPTHLLDGMSPVTEDNAQSWFVIETRVSGDTCGSYHFAARKGLEPEGS